MKFNRLTRWTAPVLLISSLMPLLGCSSAPAVAVSKSSAASLPAAGQKVTYVSSRLSSVSGAESCPQGDRSWRKESLRNLMAYAESCARLGRSERVEQLGDHLAQKHHATPWGPFYLAVAAEQRKELPRALWMINLALQRAPREGLLHYQKGRIHWALGEYKSAVESYRACVKESPRFVDAHLFLAQLHFRDQDYKNAVEHFLNVVRYEPESSVGAAGLGESYAQLGNIGSAIEFYERAVTAGPRNLTYRFRLAGLYENGQKNYESALNVYRKIKTLVSEQRTPAEEIPLDLNEKIRRLEDTIGKESNSRSQKKAEAQEAGIKKVNL